MGALYILAYILHSTISVAIYNVIFLLLKEWLVKPVNKMDTVANTISSMTNDNLMNLFDDYETKWNIEDDMQNRSNIFETLQRKFSVGCDDSDNLDAVFSNQNKILQEIESEMRVRKLIDNKENIDNLQRFNRLLERMHYSYYLMNNYLNLKRTFAKSYCENSDPTYFKYVSLIYEDLKPFQKLIYKMLRYFESNNLRKVDDWVYKEITIQDKGTHAWTKTRQIIDVIHEQCAMTTETTNWQLFTSAKDMDARLTEYFVKTKDKRFPTLQKNRHVFSFTNGVYFAVNAEAQGITCNNNGTLTDLFVPYTSNIYDDIDNSVVSCKFFNKTFTYEDNVDNFRKIDTPVLDSIFKYQNLSEEVLDICYMFLGRMLYNVGSMDNWQIIPFLLGVGGSGKSTINSVVRDFYQHEDVGIISNNYQKTFGMADIFNKFLFVAPEIKKDWTIDQAEFQEMVSGGKVNVNIKHKNSTVVDWRTPGMLAGNENPGFVDNASSIQRRVVVIRFDKKVQDGDPHLDKKLAAEIDCIMRKCNLAYLHYVNGFYHKDFWKFAPAYFLETQKLMAAASNALEAFLNSDKLVLDSENWMPFTEFFKWLNVFCVDNGYRKPTINVDFYRAPFEKYGIKVQMVSQIKYNGTTLRNQKFIFGVDFKKDELDCVNDDL